MLYMGRSYTFDGMVISSCNGSIEMKTIGTWLLIVLIMTVIAYCFVEGLERQDFIDQAKRAARMDTLLYPQTHEYHHPKPTDLAKPKVTYFQDASDRKEK